MPHRPTKQLRRRMCHFSEKQAQLSGKKYSTLIEQKIIAQQSVYSMESAISAAKQRRQSPRRRGLVWSGPRPDPTNDLRLKKGFQAEATSTVRGEERQRILIYCQLMINIMRHYRGYKRASSRGGYRSSWWRHKTELTKEHNVTQLSSASLRC